MISLMFYNILSCNVANKCVLQFFLKIFPPSNYIISNAPLLLFSVDVPGVRNKDNYNNNNNNKHNQITNPLRYKRKHMEANSFVYWPDNSQNHIMRIIVIQNVTTPLKISTNPTIKCTGHWPVGRC